MFYVYILKSEKDSTFYTGQTQDVDKRLGQHNVGRSHATKSKIPWKLVYSEGFDSRAEAMRREREIKKRKSRNVYYGSSLFISLNLDKCFLSYE